MIKEFGEYKPKIANTSFVAESADVIGNVEIEEDASIWFSAVLRGDLAKIKIGKSSNIQDGCVVHSDRGIETSVGNNVIVGHNVILHSCQVGNYCLIGMGSTILNNVKIGDNCIVGANSLLTSGKEFPPNSLIIGSPAKVVRSLTQEEIESIKSQAINYVNLSKQYM